MTPDHQLDKRLGEVEAVEKLLTYRVTERYDGGQTKGKIWLSTEASERPYAVSRDQAVYVAAEHEARFVETAS